MRTTLTALCLVLGLGIFGRAEGPSRIRNASASSSLSPTTKTNAAKPWPHEGSDLKPDPSAVWGKLDNGLRYVILPERAAPGRPSLRLYMRAGSLMETENQRGVAHFLEHMAFNGTKHFPAGEMFEYLQRLGMSAGADSNAHTGWDETVYELDLPRTSEEFTAEGLKWFRDVLDGMLLEQGQLDRERGVILSEQRARDSVDLRALVSNLTFTLPDTMVWQRMPIGKIETIRTMSRERFVDFYETWYTPARAVIVAAGNFDVKMLERLIRQDFQDAKARRGEQPDPSFGKVSPTTGVAAKLDVEQESPVVSVIMTAVAPVSNAPDCVALERNELVRLVTNSMLNKRFEKLTAAKDAPIQIAVARHERMFNLADANNLVAVCQPAQWKTAIGVLEQERRRALKYGFTATEFAEAKTSAIKIFQTLADQADTRESSSIVANIIASLATNKVATHPADDLALAKRLLAGLTREECAESLHGIWDSQGVRIWVQGNLQVAGDGDQQILDAFRQSQAIPVQPPVDEKAVRWAYTDFGPAGQIVKQQADKDLDFVEAEFANHVHVNVKRTQREKNNVRVLVSFGGGLLELPADKPGLRVFANLSFIGGGLEAHDLTDVNRALADKKVNVVFGVGDDAFQLSGSCAPAVLDTELQLCSAYLTAPGYRPESCEQFLKCIDGVYEQNEHVLGQVAVNGATTFLSSADPRFSVPPRESTRKLTMDDLKAWLAQPLAAGNMEVAIVGDVDPDQALAAAAKTIGALPPRAATKPAFAQQREVRFPTPPKTKDIPFVSQIPCAESIVAWPTSGGRDIPRSRRFGVLASVLNNRLFAKVRKDLGATYSPEVIQYASDAFPDYGYLAALVSVDPKQLAEIGPLVVKIGAELAAGKIDDDEFQRAMKPVLSSIDDLDNGYWLNLLGHCHEHPEFLDAARGRSADYASITKADLEALARQYLTADKATIINVSPKSPRPTAL
jgi:zinc protease